MNLAYQRLLTIKDNNLVLRCRYDDKETAKSIPGRRWDPELKAWTYPLKTEILHNLISLFPGLRVDKAVTLAMAEQAERETVANSTRIAGWESAEPIEPMPLKPTVKPFKHQIAGYNIGITLPAAALLMEQGCGKSLTAVAIAGRRFIRGEAQRVLVVCPTSVVPVWPREFADYANFPHDVMVLEGSSTERVSALWNWRKESTRLQVAVINYESTWRIEEALAAWQPGGWW